MTEPTKLESALDELLSGKSTEEIVGPDGLLKQLTKALIERAMNTELNHHLGYEKHAPEGRGSGNNRNGSRASDHIPSRADAPEQLYGEFTSRRRMYRCP